MVLLAILTQNMEIIPESFIKNNVTVYKVFQTFIKTIPTLYTLNEPIQPYPMLN